MQQIATTGDKDAGEVQLTAAETPNEGERLRCRRANACYVATNMETISLYVPLWLVIIRPFSPPPPVLLCRAAFKLSV